MTDIDALYARYRAGALDRKQFEEQLCRRLIEHQKKAKGPVRAKDGHAGLISDLYPALRRAIDAYKEVGSSFEAYIFSKMYWASRGCRTRELKHAVAESVFWTDRALESRDRQGGYLEEPFSEPFALSDHAIISNPRQILFLILKSYWYLSDDFIERAAPVIGIDAARLTEMVRKLREMRITRDVERRGLQERLERQRYRCMLYADRVKDAPEGSAARARAERRLAKARERCEAMQKRRAAMSESATNRQVACVLGIPKGTVDSNLYTLKQRHKSPQQPPQPPAVS
ncbi:MAG: hypothetical protein LBD24_05495 [Spirochaetaceae bacterium]|nr:hypothetical protein [Spirochaetaceae bacterium]